MKNSSKLLALGLVLFLGACSAAEGDFLKKVEGKTAYSSETTQNDNTKVGTFSSDGKTFTFSGFSLKFDKATDDSTADYTASIAGQSVTYVIKTTDGKKANISSSGTEIGSFFLK